MKKAWQKSNNRKEVLTSSCNANLSLYWLESRMNRPMAGRVGRGHQLARYWPHGHPQALNYRNQNCHHLTESLQVSFEQRCWLRRKGTRPMRDRARCATGLKGSDQ
jgi:hypothetical protein